MTRPHKPTMHRKFIALVLAAAVTITGFAAAPARADEDVAKVIFGLTALAILGAAIRDSRQNDPVVVSQGDRGYDSRPHHHPHRGHGWVPPRPLPPNVARYTLPAHCQKPVPGLRGRPVLGLRCLKQSYPHVNSLPRACRIEVEKGRRERDGYSTQCLRNRGYRLSLR